MAGDRAVSIPFAIGVLAAAPFSICAVLIAFGSVLIRSGGAGVDRERR